jgi:hypothetical protein
MKRNDKYFQKTGRDVIPGIIEFVEQTIPGLKGKLPSAEVVSEFIPTKSQMVEYGLDYGKKQIKSKTKSGLREMKFSRPESSGSFLSGNTSGLTSSAQNYVSDVSSKSKEFWSAQSNIISNSINRASKVTSEDAKNFVALSGKKIGNITAQQIDKVFDSNAVIGLMATSKTTNELKNKIAAGIALNKLTKEKSYKKTAIANSRSVGIE